MIAKEVRRKSSRSKPLIRKNVRRKNVGRKTLRRKNVGRKTLRRKNMGRKTMRRKNVKRKTLRKGGSFFERIQKCIGMDCNRQHIGVLSTDEYGKKLTVTNYLPPPEDPLQYYNEEPLSLAEMPEYKKRSGQLDWMVELELNAIKRLVTIIGKIGKDKYLSDDKISQIISSGIFERVNISTKVCVGNVDLGLKEKGYPILSLLAKKLLRYFNEMHTEWGVMVPRKDHLRVVYENDNSNIQVAHLYMKMKSYSEEENEELFNKGTAHMIAYLIYNYEKLDELSDVSRFINEIQKST